MAVKNLVILKAYISPQEKAELQALAKQTNLSLSHLLRRLLVGRKLPDPTQQALGKEIVHLRADMARLGNLFKMALENEEFNKTTSHRDINAIIDEIRQTKDRMTQAIEKL